MAESYFHLKLIFFFLLILINPALAHALSEKEESEISAYQEVLTRFSEAVCPSGTREQFETLHRAYRAQGFYLPTQNTGEADDKTVVKYLPLIEEKLQWIQEQKTKLPKKDQFPKSKTITRPVTRTVHELLKAKQDMDLSENPKKKTLALKTSKKLMSQLKTRWESLISEVPFLTGFRYPVDHFDNRFRFEQAKAKSDKRQSNEIYFMRKILEDGAFDPDHSRPDMYLRTTLDTISVQLSKQDEVLSENLRFDIEWSLKMIQKQLERGYKVQLGRLQEWEQRTREQIDFYQKITKSTEAKRNLVMDDRSRASQDLRDFVYRKHAETYSYFLKQSELIQKLFVLDQILLNEAGQATLENYRDRQDIVQLVINRTDDPVYSKIDKSETLYPFLKKHAELTDEVVMKHKWLNVLFKEEQFSFTLYSMPASLLVFCPDVSRIARNTRDKNLILSMESLEKPSKTFKGIRYFSRLSMIGKVDISKMWPGFKALMERPGTPLTETGHLQRALKKSKYRYLYQFKDSAENTYRVLEINNRIYTVEDFPEKPKFYNYSSPHNFTFFEAPLPESSGLSKKNREASE